MPYVEEIVCPHCETSGALVYLGSEVVLPAAECNGCGWYWILSESEKAKYGRQESK